MTEVDLSHTPSPHSLENRLARLIWGGVRVLLFRPSPKPLHCWRRMLLRLFGARIGHGAVIHSSCRIWAPWNLEMGDFSCLSFDVDCYSVDRIHLGAHAVVSQYCFLCTASHDIEDPSMHLTTSPIVVGRGAWIAAGAFIAPGVTVGDGAVVGARSVVTHDVAPLAIVAGNPARVIKQRRLREPLDRP